MFINFRAIHGIRCFSRAAIFGANSHPPEKLPQSSIACKAFCSASCSCGWLLFPQGQVDMTTTIKELQGNYLDHGSRPTIRYLEGLSVWSCFVWTVAGRRHLHQKRSTVAQIKMLRGYPTLYTWIFQICIHRKILRITICLYGIC